MQTYSYDSLNRLTSSTELNDSTQTWKQTFTFDRVGNKSFDEANTSFGGFDKLCNSNTELCADLRKKLNPAINTSDNRFSAGQDDGYDSSGNTTDDPYGREFIYDAENKQVKVLDDQDETIGKYFYDGDGRRVKKPVPSTGEVTIFVYDASEDSARIGAVKIAHEFGHLDDFRSKGSAFKEEQSLMDEFNSKSAALFGAPPPVRMKDKTLAEIQQKFSDRSGISVEQNSVLRDRPAERNAIPTIK